MGRSRDTDRIRGLIREIRDRIPDVCLRTTMIVGFPGEKDEDFDELARFVRDARFDKLGVFCYSKEEGTPAMHFGGHVPDAEKERRRDVLMTIQQRIAEEISASLQGKVLDVVIDGVDEDGIFYVGRSYREAPDIDGVVRVASDRPLEAGETVAVRIVDHQDYDLTGITRREE
jgi:ribosomal protein S12 methylthiotransferase